MKYFNPFMLASLLTLGVAGFGQAMPGGPPGGAPIPMEADADGDGIVTRDEMELYRTNAFDTADADASGALSLAELQAYEDVQRALHQAEIFTQMDANDDGTISQAEFVNGAPETSSDVAARLYALAVGDKTGLTAETLALLQGPEGLVLHQFASLDLDSDFQLSLEEFLAPPAGGAPGEGGAPPLPGM